MVAATAPLNGLSARATYTLLSSTQLQILLENTSTGVPAGFEVSDSLIVSLGFNLPGGVEFQSGDVSVIGPGSVGIGSWSVLSAGDTVADQWVWSNEGAGDLLQSFSQVVTTSNGLGGASATHFTGGSGNISGPFGGIAASPPHIALPGSEPAASDSILFALTLTGALTEQQLAGVFMDSIVEYGSDMQYLTPVPSPTSAVLGGLGMAALFALRRRLFA